MKPDPFLAVWRFAYWRPIMARRLTAAFIQEVCKRIQAGAFDHVACESLGVPFEQFQKWLVQGQRKRSSKMPRLLWEAVRQARASARLFPEMALRNDHPRVWLLQGPGKETGDAAGWSTPVKPKSEDEAGTTTIPEEFFFLFKLLLDVLNAFPGSREAVIAATNQAKLREEFQKHDIVS
jgi:hypothetical protein